MQGTNEKQEIVIVNKETVENKIYYVRGQKN